MGGEYKFGEVQVSDVGTGLKGKRLGGTLTNVFNGGFRTGISISKIYIYLSKI